MWKRRITQLAISGIYPGRASGGWGAGLADGGQEAGEFGPFLCLASIRAPLLPCASSSAFPQLVCHQSAALPLLSWALLP